MHTVAGAAAVGASLGSGWWQPQLAWASFPGTAVPIPGGSPAIASAFGTLYHVFAPVGLDPIDAEPATVGNFNGFVGLAYLNGMVTRTNTKTGEIRRLPFVGADMRFMQGEFRGTDGKVHQGTFVFV